MSKFDAPRPPCYARPCVLCSRRRGKSLAAGQERGTSFLSVCNTKCVVHNLSSKPRPQECSHGWKDGCGSTSVICHLARRLQQLLESPSPAPSKLNPFTNRTMCRIARSNPTKRSWFKSGQDVTARALATEWGRTCTFLFRCSSPRCTMHIITQNSDFYYRSWADIFMG